MKRLVIAVDCDDVLVPCTEYLVHEYNKLFGTSIDLSTAHMIKSEEWGSDRAEVHRRLDQIQLSEEYGQIVPYAGAIDTVKRLANSYDLHMITARPEAIMGVIHKMIEKYFADCFISILHIGPNGNKGEACAALHADVLIDDNYKHHISAEASGIQTRLWFGDYPWQAKSSEPGVITARCRTWSDVEVEIVKLTT